MIALFGVSAIFHNLGPALAVLLFAHVDVLGVTWLRIVGAAVVFALWRRPWRAFGSRSWRAPLRLGVVLALMNAAFYLAIERLPLATVSAIEFLGVVALAAAGARNRRNLVALVLAVAGVGLLTELRLAGQPLGFGFAFANLVLFVGYVVLAHRIANHSEATRWGGIDQLGAAMLVAAVVATPFGIGAGAGAAFVHPGWLLAGAGVGICSSVVPYILDQVVMARVRRATFALLLSLLPAWATIIGAVVLAQRPTAQDLAGVALVAVAVALHRGPAPPEPALEIRPPAGRSDQEGETCNRYIWAPQA